MSEALSNQNPQQPKEEATSKPLINSYHSVMDDEDMVHLNNLKNILDVDEADHPEFTLAKNKARFKKKLLWYKSKKDWLDIASMQKINKLFKEQMRELETIRSNKMDCEIELETVSLTPSQKSYRKDELKILRAYEKMAIQLVSKIQLKFKFQSGK